MKIENFLKKNLNADIVYKCTLSRVFWTKASESSLEDDA